MSEKKTSKNALAVSICLNVILGAVVVYFLWHPPATSVKPRSKAAAEVDHLVLQVRCGKGDKQACQEVLETDISGCENGDGHSCTLLGIYHQGGKHVPKDEAQAAKYFEKACSLGDGAGCWYCGTTHQGGVGVPKNLDRAIELLKKACDKNQVNGCLSLGQAYERYEPPELDKALAAYERACKLKYETGCRWAERVRAKK